MFAMTRIWPFRGGPRPDETQEIELKEAIAFWQKEVHYYEGRAGAQGDAAGKLLTVAAGTSAALPIISRFFDQHADDAPDVRILLALPVLLLLLWSTALRLLHEMEMLRVYVEKSERELQALTAQQPTLRGYERWSAYGAKHDFSFHMTAVFGAAVLSLSVAATVGVSLFVVQSAYPGMEGYVWAIFLCAILTLGVGYAFTHSEKKALSANLGMPVEKQPESLDWVRLIAIVVPLVVVGFGVGVAASLSMANAIETSELAGWVLGTSIAILVPGLVADYLTRTRPRLRAISVAGRTLVVLALAGSAFVALGDAYNWSIQLL